MRVLQIFFSWTLVLINNRIRPVWTTINPNSPRDKCFSPLSDRWSLISTYTATDVFKPLPMSDGCMILMMDSVTHVTQMAGRLTQSTLGCPPGEGRGNGRRWRVWGGGGGDGVVLVPPQGLSCGWVKVIIAPILLCPLALNTCGLMWCKWSCEGPAHP